MNKTSIPIFLSVGVLILLGANFAGDYNGSQDLDYCHETKACVDWLNKNYVSEVSYDKDRRADNQTFSVVISELYVKNADQDNKIAVVEAKSFKPVTAPVSPPVVTPSASLSLIVRTSDASGFKYEYGRGEIVYISGSSKDPISNIRFQIISDSTNQVLNDNTFNTDSTGRFTKVFITDDKTVIGVYTAKFTWNISETDFIKFKIT